MGKAPLYFSETTTIGPNTYLMEVKRSQRGQKYFRITKTNARPDEDQAVVVFPYAMGRFMKMIERATKAMLTTVPTVEDAETRKLKRQVKVKANPPEFGNSGKRWTQTENELLAEQFQMGTSMETLMKLFKRRSTAIEVRLYKLGFLPSRENRLPSARD